MSAFSASGHTDATVRRIRVENGLCPDCGNQVRIRKGFIFQKWIPNNVPDTAHNGVCLLCETRKKQEAERLAEETRKKQEAERLAEETRKKQEADKLHTCVATLQGHSNWVYCLVLSESTKRLYSGSGDDTIMVWDTTTNTKVATLQGHSDTVRCLVLSESTKRLYSGSDDKTIMVWDTTTNAKVATLQGHSNWVNCLVLSESTKRLYSGSSDKTIMVWNVLA